jgi:hypothetical protein
MVMNSKEAIRHGDCRAPYWFQLLTELQAKVSIICLLRPVLHFPLNFPGKTFGAGDLPCHIERTQNTA